nr:reverse transcriptase domain-containing protein [Tanacetum cinerariifolium]
MIRETTEKIVHIKNRLLTACSLQKSYADVRHRPLEFDVGDKVMLKVSPWKGVIRFGKRRKLSPRYIRPFKVLERVGPVAYKLELPRQLQGEATEAKPYTHRQGLLLYLERTCAQQADRDIYSAFAVDNAVQSCFFENQLTSFSPKN